MAQGAHLATSNVERPSIFELIASQSLDATFYPAFKKIALYLGSKNPDRYQLIVKYYDEVFLAFNAIVQNYYLHKNGASISESFYGLTRFNLKTNQFKRRDFIVSFAVLVIIPYLLRKLDKKVTTVKEKLEDELSNDDKYKFIGVYTYKTLKASYEFAQIIKYISYLSGRSKTHNIPLFLSSIGLRHANLQDDSFSFSDIISGNVKFSTVIGSMVLRTLEFGGFFLQFLQWYQESSASQKIISQLPTPIAPKQDSDAKKYSNICPLCYQHFAIPTVLTISGYVFCYKCITKHLRRHQYCPVTNYPATMDDLTRLYDNN
ncbi:hypothetical protein PVAND_013101 [Polypedilum vanderplanki]|uniref:Peroxisome assembly protein 12 n=1 Tax=Polypedilum vanderplanki TaxID=319348 RepID=A0A9J6CQF4_POLVA|nr:hypothetical protein PVAND_013101 [Polypedilum vanderplanki]